MSKCNDVRDSLDQLKMLSCDGMFDKKEGWWRKRVSPEPDQKYQVKQTREENEETTDKLFWMKRKQHFRKKLTNSRSIRQRHLR